MILIACIDDDNGMMFNNRRQSRDRELTGRIRELTAAGTLHVSSYTGQLFDGTDHNLEFDDDPFVHAGRGEFVFAEDIRPGPYEEGLEQIILFRWNRRYPSDVKFDIPLSDHGWKLVRSREFAGSSHDKISEEVYRR